MLLCVEEKSLLHIFLTLIQILVYAETDEALEYAKTQIPVIMSQTVSVSK